VRERENLPGSVFILKGGLGDCPTGVPGVQVSRVQGGDLFDRRERVRVSRLGETEDRSLRRYHGQPDQVKT